MNSIVEGIQKPRCKGDAVVGEDAVDVEVGSRGKDAALALTCDEARNKRAVPNACPQRAPYHH